MAFLYLITALILAAFLVWSLVGGGRQAERARAMELRAKLNSFRQLSDGWDGYDAKPIEPGILEKAMHLVECMELTGRCGHFEVFPCVDGTVQFELDRKGKKYWFIVNVERRHYMLSTNSDVLDEGECSDTEAVFDWMLRAMSLDR